jgi:hypothetical protein
VHTLPIGFEKFRKQQQKIAEEQLHKNSWTFRIVYWVICFLGLFLVTFLNN